MRERNLSKILVIPTAIVVLVLGGLLYRWSNQVSESTSARLADSLQMSLANWHLNFYRDLSDIAGALRVDFENSSNLDLYARRFKEWTATTQYRGLAVNLYVLQEVASKNPRALQLDSESREFQPVAWPSSLVPLREALKKLPPGKGDDTPPFPRGLAGWKFEPATPSLIRRIDSLAGSWLVVELDRKTIQERILPDLAKRYFMGVDGLDYLIAVVSGPQHPEVLYSSDAGFGAQDVTDADGRIDVFGEVTERRFGSPIYVFHKLSENMKLSGMAASMGTQWFPLLEGTSPENGWQLIVRHRRGGPLGAFVSEMHRRDLAISFGVLFLLVAMVAMLIVTSLRANRLAKLQMDFVTAVSHELRSPLAIISSAAENISQGVVEGKEQVAQYGRAIEGQARRLSQLVEEVLGFAATRDNRHRYDLRLLDTNDIIDATLAGTADLIEAARFTVERNIQPNLPQVRGDLPALSQCLQNLITNALKYSGGQRWIGIRASVLSDANGSREVQIKVSDHGIGIAREDLPRIFDPFFRSPAVTSAQIHGTGLGLSLAKNIAEAMQGRLTVSSKPGDGTTFTLHLPVGTDGRAAAQDLSVRLSNPG